MLQETTKTLNRADADVIKTTKEVLDFGIRHSQALPEPVKCEFCGNTLYHECIVFMGRVATVRNVPQRCSCEKAQKYWKEQDALEAVRKEQEEKRRAKEKEEADFQRRLKRSLIGKKHQPCRLNNFICKTPQQKAAVRQAADYIMNFAENKKSGTGLYIEGTPGTGKTHIASAVCMELLKQKQSVIMQTQSDMFRSIKSAYGDDYSLSEDKILNRYRKPDLLIIDDLGKYTTSNWGMSTLYDIINYRYEEMLPTIITTNYNEEDLIRRLTPKDGDSMNIIAIISRLRETTRLISMAWQDYRSSPGKTEKEN